MGRALAILTIVMRRSLANRRLLATVVVGVMLSAALMSTVVLYSDTVRDLGLKHTLEAQDPFSLDVQLLSSSQPMAKGDYARLRKRTDDLTQAQIGGILKGQSRFTRSATFFLTAPGAPVNEKDENRPRAHFQYAERMQDHVKVVVGRLPAPSVAPADNSSAPTVEAVLARATAERLGVTLGQTFDLHPFWKLQVDPVKVVVTGFIEQNNPDEPYWFRKPERFLGTGTSWPTYPFFVDEQAITDVVAGYLPEMDGTLETFAFVDTSRINSANAHSVEDRVRGLDDAIRAAVPRTNFESKLAETIKLYRNRLFFTRLPLFALMLQVVGIVLYYLVMVATMLQERQAGEIALLRSRGASTAQIMGIYAIEGMFICGGAALVGPFIAVLGIGLLGYTPPFHDLSNGSRLDVPLTGQAFLLALLGSALALAALLLPAYQAARKTMVDYKQSLARPQQQPLFLRYYLDLVLIGAGAFAFYQLRQNGSLVTDRLFGDLSADPLLLVSPTLFMLMVALVFVRLFPLGLRLVSWLARGLSGPTVALGMWRMVRSPLHYSRLILLLLLATAVGMFAAGYRATLERGYDDRSSYEAGAPARLQDVRLPSGLPNDVFTASIQRATGAQDLTPVARIDGSYNISTFKSADLDVLGVVPAEFEKYVFWRDDFAGPTLNSLMTRLVPPEGTKSGRGPAIPAGARFIGVWAQFPLAPANGQPWIRLKDSTGSYFDYRLITTGPPVPNTWQFFTADLTRPATFRPGGVTVRDATLDAVYLRLTGNPPPVPERLTVLFDDVQVAGGAALPADVSTAGFADGTVIESFEADGPYELVAGVSSIGDPGSISRTETFAKNGRASERVSFTRTRGTPAVVGIRVQEGRALLPVIVSQPFLDATKTKVGDELNVYMNRQYVKVKLTGAFDLFPSFDPTSRTNLMVADLASLQALASRVPSSADAVYANEAWMSAVPEGALEKATLEKNGVSAEQRYDRSAIRAEQSADPLVAASWEGILFLSFASVLGLTALGFTVYATLAARARALEFAILRTMGYSTMQILALVSFEQLFVIVAGVAAGTLLGFPLGRLMIGYLGVTEGGRDPLPPLLSQVSWTTVGTVYGLLALVFIGTIGALAATYSRLAVHRALRIGEI